MNEEMSNTLLEETITDETQNATHNSENLFDNNDYTDITETSEALKQEISSLKKELDAYKAAESQREYIANQINEFSELFPEISVRSIPDEVWDDVKKGNSLAAAYSVYERRITEAARRIELINASNAKKSAGAVGKDTSQEFFSADEVRKMSPSEVRANYAKIRRSMEKWN